MQSSAYNSSTTAQDTSAIQLPTWQAGSVPRVGYAEPFGRKDTEWQESSMHMDDKVCTIAQLSLLRLMCSTVQSRAQRFYWRECASGTTYRCMSDGTDSRKELVLVTRCITT